MRLEGRSAPRGACFRIYPLFHVIPESMMHDLNPKHGSPIFLDIDLPTAFQNNIETNHVHIHLGS